MTRRCYRYPCRIGAHAQQLLWINLLLVSYSDTDRNVSMFQESSRKIQGEEILEPFFEAFEQGATSVAEISCAKVIKSLESPDERYVISLVW